MRCIQAFSATALVLLLRSVTAGATPAEYPLRVFVVQTTSSRTQELRNGVVAFENTSGQGHANLQEGSLVSGFDFSFACSLAPTPSSGDPFIPLTGYQGRWKKQGARLAVLVTEIGNPKHQSECELKTNLLDSVYSISQGQLTSYSRQQFDDMVGWRKAAEAMTHPADTDPAHFPVRVSIMEAQWQNHAGGGVMGEGRGNVLKADSGMAFTFNAPRCVAVLSDAAQRNIYQGKWLEEPTRLLLLAHSVGTAPGTGVNECELETRVQPDNVFIRNVSTGVIQTLTQDQNKARLQAARTTQQPSAAAGVNVGARPAASPIQKLSIASNPDGADIEVDGAFVGSTPSVVNLGLGEHNVVIRKQGYKPWERKLRLVGGDVKVNADLEKP